MMLAVDPIFPCFMGDEQVRVTNIRNIIDALGLIWFVVGNMWLYGLDET